MIVTWYLNPRIKYRYKLVISVFANMLKCFPVIVYTIFALKRWMVTHQEE